MAIRSYTKGRIFTRQTGHSFRGDPYPNLLGYTGKKEHRVAGVMKRRIPLTNDYEHLLISLAFIIVGGKRGLVCATIVFGKGAVEEEADKELSLSVGG